MTAGRCAPTRNGEKIRIKVSERLGRAASVGLAGPRGRYGADPSGIARGTESDDAGGLSYLLCRTKLIRLDHSDDASFVGSLFRVLPRTSDLFLKFASVQSLVLQMCYIIMSLKKITFNYI